MNKLGFDGGHSIYEFGPAPDVVLFFDCVKIYAERDHPEQDRSLLTDHLYRRYLRREEIKPALLLMGQVRALFVQRPAKSSIEWDAKVLANSEKSWLNPEQRHWLKCSATILNTLRVHVVRLNHSWMHSTSISRYG